MKKTFIFIFSAAMLFGVSSCHHKKVNKNIENAQEAADSMTDYSDELGKFLDKHEDQYPMNIELFSNEAFTERMKKLTGNRYDEIVKNFNVQSPIVEENDIYKFTGGKEHDVPAFLTTVIFDKKANNLNVWIEQNGKKTIFVEKDTIHVSKSLLEK